MEIKVITIGSELESAQRLGYKTSTNSQNYARDYENYVIIRWGNSGPCMLSDGQRSGDYKNVINPADKIRLNCLKNKSTKLLAQVVNVPALYEKNIPENVLAVVRPIEHSAGSGFSVKKGPLELQEGTYATKFLKTEAEYRVWFCGKRTMGGRRVKMSCNEEQEFPCRSKWGYEFCDSISKDLHNQTLLAAKKIGLDCGAADILFYKGKWYFLELNSAPSVDHRVVREFYQNALKELISYKFKKKESDENKPEIGTVVSTM